MSHPPPARRGALAATVVVLLVLSLVPARFGGWANGLGDNLRMLITPVSGPVYQVVRWFSPAEPAKSEAVTVLERDRDRWKGMYLNKLVEIEDLKRKLDQFGKGAMYSDLPLAQILRPVVGTSAEPGGQIIVRAGARDGVEVNSIATTEGVQIVGKVTAVGPRTSTVRLISEKSAGRIDGVIMTADEVRGPKALKLQPLGGGLFQTRVRVEAGEKPPEQGQLVRLDDKEWPKSAQMLVIGAIDRPPQADAVGWYIVSVRPTVDLERLSEVVLRISRSEDSQGAPPATGSTDGGDP